MTSSGQLGKSPRSFSPNIPRFCLWRLGAASGIPAPELTSLQPGAVQSRSQLGQSRALGSASWLWPAPVSCSSRWDFFPPLSFQLLDLKIFVDTDSDIRLVRRLRRDISERGRDIEGVIKQYNKFVKPAFDQYIQPTMRLADIVVPRGTATCLGPGGRGQESGKSKGFFAGERPKNSPKAGSWGI